MPKKIKTLGTIPSKNIDHFIAFALFSSFAALMLTISFFLSFFLLALGNRLHGQPPETPKTEMKTLPQDVKNKLTTLPAPNTTYKVPILMYHYVEYVKDKRDTIRQSLNVNPNEFEKQILTLKNAGYTFITAADFGNVLNGKKTLPQKPIIITFDDGHWDLATNVLPILKKYNIKVTAYIIPGFLNGSDFLTTAQLQEVVSSKLVDVGAHTVHHLALKGRPLATDVFEVTQSKQMLEKEFGIHVVSFAYPYGSFDQVAADEVKAAGFTTAVSTLSGNNQSDQNRYFLYRLRPGYRDGQSLLSYINATSYAYYQASPSAIAKK